MNLLVFNILVMAASPVSFDVAAQIRADDIVTVSIAISSKSDIAALSIELDYDDNSLIYIAHTGGEITDGCILKVNVNKQNKVIVACISTDGLQMGGVLFSVDFKILNERTKQNISPVLSITEAVTNKYESVAVKINQTVLENPYYQTTGSLPQTVSEIHSDASKAEPSGSELQSVVSGKSSEKPALNGSDTALQAIGNRTDNQINSDAPEEPSDNKNSLPAESEKSQNNKSSNQNTIGRFKIIFIAGIVIAVVMSIALFVFIYIKKQKEGRKPR